jgi:hypothetical protein
MVGLKIVGFPYKGKSLKHFNDNKRVLQYLYCWLYAFSLNFHGIKTISP